MSNGHGARQRASSPGLHVGHRLGSRHHSSKMERRLRCSSQHHGTGFPKSLLPPTQTKGWDAAGGKWQGGKGKGRKEGSYACHGPDTTQTEPQAWEVPLLKPGMWWGLAQLRSPNKLVGIEKRR